MRKIVLYGSYVYIYSLLFSVAFLIVFLVIPGVIGITARVVGDIHVERGVGPGAFGFGLLILFLFGAILIAKKILARINYIFLCYRNRKAYSNVEDMPFIGFVLIHVLMVPIVSVLLDVVYIYLPSVLRDENQELVRTVYFVEDTLFSDLYGYTFFWKPYDELLISLVLCLIIYFVSISESMKSINSKNGIISILIVVHFIFYLYYSEIFESIISVAMDWENSIIDENIFIYILFTVITVFIVTCFDMLLFDINKNNV